MCTRVSRESGGVMQTFIPTLLAQDWDDEYKIGGCLYSSK